MPTQLPQSILTLLKLYNGPWTPFVVDPNAAIVNGTTENDNMTITSMSNLTVNGAGGNDRIDASSITNGLNVSTLNGGAGDDQIFGSGGNNVIIGGDGNDLIEGRGGTLDTLNGNGGIDTLSYEHSPAGVTINMSGAVVTASGGHATGDVIGNDFENVVGSAFNDTITGNSRDNVLIGLGGNDTINGNGGNDLLQGGAGADVLNGGAGIDTVDYSNSQNGVSIDLPHNLASLGDAAGDSLSNIEGVNGSPNADTIGVGANQVAYGGGGVDQLFAYGNGAKFVYKAFSDAPVGGAVELIVMDGVPHTTSITIDLSAIDPDGNAGNGNGTFVWNQNIHDVYEAGSLRHHITADGPNGTQMQFDIFTGDFPENINITYIL